MSNAQLVTLEGDLGFSTARMQAFMRKKLALQKLQDYARKKGAPRYKNRFFSLLGNDCSANLYSGYDIGAPELLGKGINWAKIRAGLRKGIGFAANVFVPGSGAIIEKTMEAADKAGIGPKIKVNLAKKNFAKVVNDKLAKLSPRQKKAVAAAKAVYDGAIKSGKPIYDAIAASKNEMKETLDMIPESKGIDLKKAVPYAAAGMAAILLFSKVKK